MYMLVYACICMYWSVSWYMSIYLLVYVCICSYHTVYACICMYMIISYCICMYCAYQHAGNQWKRQNGHLQMMGCPPIFLYITVSRGPLIWVATQLELSYNLNSYWYANFILSVFFTDTYRHIQTHTDTYRHIQTHKPWYIHILSHTCNIGVIQTHTSRLCQSRYTSSSGWHVNLTWNEMYWVTHEGTATVSQWPGPFQNNT